jgi:hypothetical protein
MSMPGHLPCTVRVVAFAGHGETAEPGVQTVPLAHCLQLIEERMQGLHSTFAGTHFRDEVLSFVALRQKLSTSGRTRPFTLMPSRNRGKGGSR